MRTAPSPGALCEIALQGLRDNSDTLRSVDDAVELAVRRYREGELSRTQYEEAFRFCDRFYRNGLRKREYYLELLAYGLGTQQLDPGADELHRLLQRGEKLINREDELLEERARMAL